MRIPDSSCSEGGKEPCMKDAMDIVFAAKIRPESAVGPAFGKDLIKKYVFLDSDFGAHAHHPVTGFTGTAYERC